MIEAPSEDSPDWYKRYHNSFYVSQLANNLLVSYMRTVIELHNIPNILQGDKDWLEQEGFIRKSEAMPDRFVPDETVLKSFAVKSFLRDIAIQFEKRPEMVDHLNACMGFRLDGFFPENTEIDIDDLEKSFVTKNWHKIISGFLNIWEFTFLFSLTETALKEVICDGDEQNHSLLKRLDKKCPSVFPRFGEETGFTKKFSVSAWQVYNKLRNTYAHTYGVFSEDKIIDFERAVKKLRRKYTELCSLSLSSLMPEPEELFNRADIQIGKFYLLGDYELNLFKWFSSQLLHVTSEELKKNS